MAVSCFALVLVLILWFTIRYRSERALVKRADCASHLRAISSCIVLYAEEHGGRLPDDLQQMVGDNGAIGGSSFVYVCPGSGTTFGALSNIAVWTDYCFVLVPKSGNIAADSALIYDRRLSNHGKEGVNVAVIGTLHTTFPPPGALFWDSNAKWLQKFAEQRPDVAIPMPE